MNNLIFYKTISSLNNKQNRGQNSATGYFLKVIVLSLSVFFLFALNNAKAQCNIGFDIDKTGPYCLNSDTVFLSAWDTIQTGGCMDDPGFLMYIKLDANSAEDNNITLYEDGKQIAYYDGSNSSFLNSGELKIWGWFMNNGHTFSFKWCDKSYDGTFPYKLYDRATLLLLDSGTVDGSKGCTTIIIPHFSGKAIYSGDGVTNLNDGTGYFIPSQAGPGTHIISYYWNNEHGIAGTYTRTFVVNPSPPVNLGKDTVLCNGASIVLHAGGNNYTYKWNNFSTKDSLKVNKQGKYYVVVTDKNGCTNSDTININTDNIKINLGKYDSLCVGSTVTLDAGVSPATYIWNNNSHDKTISVSKQGTYSVTVTDKYKCTSSDSIKVSYYSAKTLYLGKDQTIDIDTTIVLHAGSGFKTYKWQDGSTDSTFTVKSRGKYKVIAITQNGCTYSDSVNVNVTCYSKDVFIPNVFTPGNAKSICDAYFRAEGRCIGKAEISIFNRWGDKIYWNNYDFSNSMDNSSCDDKAHSNVVGKYNNIYYYPLWDGTDKRNGGSVSEGTYFYVLSYNISDDYITNNKTQKGSVTVLK